MHILHSFTTHYSPPWNPKNTNSPVPEISTKVSVIIVRKARFPSFSHPPLTNSRHAGAGPPQSKVLGDTVIDLDASTESGESGLLNTSAFPGPPSSATSQDVHKGLGHPGSGMNSKEARHDGKQQTNKKPGQGVGQWGPPKEKKVELDRGQRVTGDNIGPTSSV